MFEGAYGSARECPLQPAAPGPSCCQTWCHLRNCVRRSCSRARSITRPSTRLLPRTALQLDVGGSGCVRLCRLNLSIVVGRLHTMTTAELSHGCEQPSALILTSASNSLRKVMLSYGRSRLAGSRSVPSPTCCFSSWASSRTWPRCDALGSAMFQALSKASKLIALGFGLDSAGATPNS